MEDQRKTIKTNLEHYKSKQLISVIGIAFVLFIVCVIVAATAPPDIFGGSSLDYKLCTSSQSNFCFNQFRAENSAYFEVELSPLNQIFFLQVEFDSGTKMNEELKYDLFISNSYDLREIKYKEENKTMEIKCSDGDCDSELLFYIPYIEDKLYIVDLRFYGEIKVESMKFKIRYITKGFTDFFIGTKYFFLAMSLLALGNFAFYLCKTKTKLRHWAFETKLSTFMLFSLVIFNEPLLYYTLREVTFSWTVVSIFCNAQFCFAIVIFWYLMLHSEMSLIRKIATTIVEASLVFVFVTLLSVMYSSTIKEQKVNPTFSWESDMPGKAKAAYIAGLSILIILGFIMLTHIVLILKKIKNIDKKERLMFVFNFLMIFTTFLFIGIGAFQPLPRSGTLLLTSVSFFNIFVIALSWLYTPSLKAFYDKKQENFNGPQDIEADEKVSSSNKPYDHVNGDNRDFNRA